MKEYTTLTPAIRLVAIEALFDKDFRVASYQRGYRWTPEQINELLNDIREFLNQPDNGGVPSFYCLQPIVLRASADGAWEVVDGQQRLTTIFLILLHLDDVLRQIHGDLDGWHGIPPSWCGPYDSRRLAVCQGG